MDKRKENTQESNDIQNTISDDQFERDSKNDEEFKMGFFYNAYQDV